MEQHFKMMGGVTPEVINWVVALLVEQHFKK